MRPREMVTLCAEIDAAAGVQRLRAPVFVPSLSNVHVSPMRLHKLKKRAIAGPLGLFLQARLDRGLALSRVPLVVELWRIAPRRLDQGNIAAAHKTTQDAVARWLGIDDRHDHLVRYEYEQRAEGSNYGLEVVIRPREEEAK